MNINKSIQKALAILITHPDIAENYKDFRNQVVIDLNLNTFDIKTLDEFYENNKNKFTASAPCCDNSSNITSESECVCSEVFTNEAIS